MTSTVSDAQVGQTGARFGGQPRRKAKTDGSVATVTDDAAGTGGVGQTGARFGGGRKGAAKALSSSTHSGLEPVDNAMAGDSAFETVLRGYDRRQVDEFILRQEEVAEKLRISLAETEGRLGVATESAELLEAENRRLHESVTKQREAAKEQGFGARAEKLLQLAESEAAELRSRTVRESADLMEQSRAAAEGYRHEAEQALIVRTAELDQLAARRDADLVEREEQIAGERAAMRAEANRVKAEALNEATRLRMEAESEADAVRSRARIDAERLRDEARLDVDRLDDVRTRTQSEIRRMAKVLLASVGSDGTAGAESPTEE
jgi:cell division septum initiation protein DivIVA